MFLDLILLLVKKHKEIIGGYWADLTQKYLFLLCLKRLLKLTISRTPPAQSGTRSSFYPITVLTVCG